MKLTILFAFFVLAVCAPCAWAGPPPQTGPLLQTGPATRTPGGYAINEAGHSLDPAAPECGSAFVWGCRMPAPPSGNLTVPPMHVDPALNRILQGPLDQSNSPQNTSRRYAQFMLEHGTPEPPHPTLPGQPAPLCPSCIRQDGTVWAHQSPLLVNGRLYRRTPVLYGVRAVHPPSWYLAWMAFWVVLLAPGAYYGTKLAQDRAERRHAERVAARRVAAASRARAVAAASAAERLSAGPVAGAAGSAPVVTPSDGRLPLGG